MIPLEYNGSVQSAYGKGSPFRARLSFFAIPHFMRETERRAIQGQTVFPQTGLRKWPCEVILLLAEVTLLSK